MEKIESDYIRSTSIEHRKQFGQFYTPELIADFMLNWIFEGDPKIIYDPAFGLGKFFNVALRKKFHGIFFGTEIDPTTYNYFKKHNQNSIDNIINEDYFSRWSSNYYDSIICNPPYLRFQKFVNRKDVLNSIYRYTDIKLSGYTNISSAFLVKSIFELKNDGRLAYIMPLEFLNTGYGKKIKQFLLENGSIVNIIKLEDEESIFNEVITTIGIIFFIKNKERKSILFSKITDTSIINIPIKEISYDEINYNNKWETYFSNIQVCENSKTDLIPITSYGRFMRGIATGDNAYFTLKKSEILKYKLNFNYFKLCITKSQQVTSSTFNNENLDDLISNDNQIFLLNIEKHNLSDMHLLRYIELGIKNNVDQRYLTKNRNPWYSIENREISQLWFGVFARGYFKIIRNFTNCVTLTCYHCFYPYPLFKEYIDKIFIFLKAKAAFNYISYNKRIYGDGLLKFEPNDLNKILVPSIKLIDMIPNNFVTNELIHIKEFDCLSSDGENFIDNMIKFA